MTNGFKSAPGVHLLPVATATAFTGRDSDAVLELIERGWLRHTFNIGAGKSIRELRVWRGSLSAFIHKHEDKASLVDVLGDIFPLNRRLRASELAKSWSVTRNHIHRLIELGLITGEIMNHTCWVPRQSVVDFITARAMGCEPVSTASISG